MKKYKKQIIILASVLVVLGVILAVLLITAPETEQQGNNSGTVETYTVLSKTDVSVTSISIDNPYSEYVINYTEVENEDGSISMKYEVPGYEDVKFTTNNFKALAELFISFTADKELGEVENLEEFGLAGENASVVTATYSDGSTETITIGGVAGESNGRYILNNGKVYIGLVSRIFASDMATQVSIPSWDIAAYTESDGTASYTIEEFKLSGTNFPRDIDIYYDKNSNDYKMVSPIECSGGVSFISELSEHLISFTAGTVVKVHPTEAELEEYGLLEPYAYLEFTLNGSSHTIKVGNKIDTTKRYAIIDGDEAVVYGSYIEHINKWTESKELDYRDTYASIVYIYDVDKFTVEAGGKKVVVDLERTINPDRTTDTTRSYDYTAKVNGKEVEYEDVTKFYGSVIGIPLLNMTDTNGDGESILKVTYEFYEDEKREDMVIEYQLCKNNNDRTAAFIDGEYNVTVRTNAVKEVIEIVEEFYNNTK